MMFDVGWTELLLIGVVALIVIGPKDLPVMFQQLGRFTGKLRSMAREFQGAMEDAARESGVKDMADDLKNATGARNLGLDGVREAVDRFEKWDPLKDGLKNTSVPDDKILTSAAATVPPEPAGDAASSPKTHTQALADKQAQRQVILAEMQEKLRALDAQPDQEPTDIEKAPKA